MKFRIFIILLSMPHLLTAQASPEPERSIQDKILSGKARMDTMSAAGIKQLTGATHAGGKYYTSNEPYLVEGARKLDSLGFGILKLWFYKNPAAYYPYHSQWNSDERSTLKQLAEHVYFKQALAYPYTTIILSTCAFNHKVIWKLTQQELKQEEDEMYNLSVYLLDYYKNRSVTFILQNWEGDWLLRSGAETPGEWDKGHYPDDLAQRVAGMKAWFACRQRAVSRARLTVKTTKCRVYHAVEVNRVIDCMKGKPGLTTDVLPGVEVDMVSWSSYDGLSDNTGVALYRGIDFIRQHTRSTGVVKYPVFIGEIGIPENAANNRDEKVITQRWDAYMQAMLAQHIPYIVHWELYCNEPVDKHSNDYYPPKNAEQLKGFWLLRPDGSNSFAMNYFRKLLDRKRTDSPAKPAIISHEVR